MLEFTRANLTGDLLWYNWSSHMNQDFLSYVTWQELLMEDELNTLIIIRRLTCIHMEISWSPRNVYLPESMRILWDCLLNCSLNEGPELQSKEFSLFFSYCRFIPPRFSSRQHCSSGFAACSECTATRTSTSTSSFRRPSAWWHTSAVFDSRSEERFWWLLVVVLMSTRRHWLTFLETTHVCASRRPPCPEGAENKRWSSLNYLFVLSRSVIEALFSRLTADMRMSYSGQACFWMYTPPTAPRRFIKIWCDITAVNPTYFLGKSSFGSCPPLVHVSDKLCGLYYFFA